MTYGAMLLGQFAEPSREWDLYIDRIEREYQALIKGKSCLDCVMCEVSERHPDTGFCTQDGEFRYDTDRPEINGDECFRDY